MFLLAFLTSSIAIMIEDSNERRAATSQCHIDSFVDEQNTEIIGTQ